MNKNKKQTKNKHLLNKEIRANEVRLDGQVIRFSEALQQAESQQMDLVLMASNANPPVVKIMNYEKFIYEQNKREKQKPKNLDMKEIKIGPNTSDNDLEYRIKHMVEFLKKGHKVKLTMQFKGRELTYVDNGKTLMLKLAVSVEEHGIAENLPSLEGKRMYMTIKPKPNK
jgi:translation initiation factor IF-3